VLTAKREQVFRFVRHSLAEDYLRLGWVCTGALHGSYHDQFAELYEWLCDCPILEPDMLRVEREE
jgi:hypothetical protein